MGVRGLGVLVFGLCGALLWQVTRDSPSPEPMAITGPPTCLMTAIDATNGETPYLARSLEPLAEKLAKPPLSSWNRFRVVAVDGRRIEIGDGKTVTLRALDESVLVRVTQSGELLLSTPRKRRDVTSSVGYILGMEANGDPSSYLLLWVRCDTTADGWR